MAGYTVGSSIPNALWVVPLDGGDPVRLARTERAEPGERGRPHFEAVRWTPNGEGVIYAVHDTGADGDSDDARAEIWVVDADGGEPRRLALPLTYYELGNLRFHPNGTRIAYTVERSEKELSLAEGLPGQIRGRR